MSEINDTAIPAFAPNIRFQFDAIRDRWVVLGPERMFLPDEQAVTILNLVDGLRSVRTISAMLAEQFSAPLDVVLDDVATMLQALSVRGAIVFL
jgi:pyrroloquinoline quinone biosynthesis protein D